MKEISNSTLALLVVVAMLVSIFGTFISINRLSALAEIPVITGLATSDIGKANLTVSSAGSINLTVDLIELGLLAEGDINGTSDDRDKWWKLENIGGVNVSVELSGTQTGGQGAGPFTSTSGSGCNGNSPRTCFLVKCHNTSMTTAAGAGYNATCNDMYYSLNTSSATSIDFIVDLAYWSGNDTAWFGVNVTVPPEESAGNKEQDVTFTATSSS